MTEYRIGPSRSICRWVNRYVASQRNHIPATLRAEMEPDLDMH